MKTRVFVGNWLIEPDLNRITSGEKAVRIEPKVMDLLVFLATNPGEVCSKEKLIQNVWAGTHVGDEVLTYTISELRRAFGDSARNPSYIATIAKRGYRLIAPVTREEEQLVPAPVPAGEPPRESVPMTAGLVGPGWRRWALIAGLSVMGATFILWRLSRPGVIQEASDAQSTPASAIGQLKIAVLPFENLSPDPQNDYFADGVTEDIINQLSKINRLTITSRTAVARYRKDPILSQVGKELGVGLVLKGNIRRETNNVRISVELIEVKSGRRLWGETYDRELTKIFEIQKNVAELIASTLNIELSVAERGQIERVPTANLTAYDCYLKGREYYLRYRNHDNDIAIGLFQRALQLDPKFALAQAGLADCYAQRVYQFGFPEKWGDEALAASQNAISLDPNLAESHKALGLTYAIRGWHSKALSAYYRAVELNSSYSPAISNVGAILEAQGKFVEALQWNLRAFSLNPSAAISSYNVGEIYRDLYDEDKSDEWFSKALVLDPDYEPARNSKILKHIARRRFPEARSEDQRILAANPTSLRGLNAAGAIELFAGNYDKAKGYYNQSLSIARNLEAEMHLNLILWKEGQKVASMKFFDELMRSSQEAIKNGGESWHPRWNIAAAQAIRGNSTEALTWLERAAGAGWRPALESWGTPVFENLKGDSRYEKLMQTLKSDIEDQRRRAEATQLLSMVRERPGRGATSQ